MSLKLGNTNIGELYVGSNKIAQAYLGSNLVYQTTTPPVPPVLPANTVRVRTSDGSEPIKGSHTSYTTATKVAGTSDVYDVYKSGISFQSLLEGSTNVIEVLGANPSNVNNIGWMFKGCTSLTNVALFDTSKVTNMNYTFDGCTNVQSGALAFYQQASTQSNPPSKHTSTFRNCGKNTQTGAAELAQIPSDWK